MSTIPPPWSKPDAEPNLEPWKWKPGQSGNPAGRKPGTKTKRTLVGEAFEKRCEAVAEAVVTAAIAGDMQAAKLCIERVQPPLRNEGPRVKFTFDHSKSLTGQAQDVVAEEAVRVRDEERRPCHDRHSALAIANLLKWRAGWRTAAACRRWG